MLKDGLSKQSFSQNLDGNHTQKSSNNFISSFKLGSNRNKVLGKLYEIYQINILICIAKKEGNDIVLHTNQTLFKDN